MTKRTLMLVLCVLVMPAWVLPFGGCAGIQQHKVSIARALAVDVGYVAYRAAPRARLALSALCLLQGANAAPKALRERMKELLGQVWIGANDADAQLVVLSLNNLVGMIGLLDEPAEGDAPIWREALRGICEGSEMASRGIQ